MSQASKKLPPYVLPVVFAAVAAGAFALGRGSKGHNPAPAPSVSTDDKPGEKAEKPGGDADKGGDEAKGEAKGEIKFDPESLKLAQIEVQPVGYAAALGRLDVTGTVEPNLGGVVKITPRVAGKITAVRVNVGDNVRGGQALATLASTELAQAQAAYRQAGGRVQVAYSTLLRQRKLAGLGQFGRPRVEEARAADAVAQGEINASENDLMAARTGVAEARSEKTALEGEAASAEAQVVSAQSAIAEAEGQVRSLRAALSQAQTGVKVARSKFERADALLKDQLVSRQDWEQAQADYGRAQADVEAAQANIAQGQSKVEAARAQLRAAQAGVRAAEGRVQQAAAKIDTALARQAQAEGKLTAARKRGEITSQALAREEKVFQGGFLSSKEVVEAEAAWRQAGAEQRAVLENIRLLGGTPGGGNLLAITAPIAGRITERTVSLGETVTPEKALFTVINLDSVWVQLSVYQKDIAGVRVGQPVTVVSEAAPGRVFPGAVSSIGDQVDETTRTVKVRCVIHNPGSILKPQTFVRGTIAAGGRVQALAVPRDAVQEVEGKKVVFVPSDHAGEFRSRPVETGETASGQTVIRFGLKPGDRVVTRGAFMVKAQAMKSELKDAD